ncbi:MAG: argininosuccinate synthase [Acidimicrobiia bacterium]|nr:MAG: argininosuccinate synthase [Acidimicrobiia bacterium]
MTKRVVLAYSGGLDTSVAVRWMREQWGVEVVACAVDVGQLRPGEDAEIAARARAAGAVEVEVIDAREQFARDFIVPALAANALYEGRYPLVSALSRPVIVEHLVASARRHRADAVAHGCTGKGNDQVRFEVSSRILAPDLEVLAPVRVWGLTRADCVALAGKWDIPIEATVEKLYSIDENMWGRAIECGVLENPWAAPPEEPFTLTRTPADAPREPRELVVGFEAGVPVALDGEATDLVRLIGAVGDAVGAYGWGRIDMVENRRVGIKSREVYECPASLALITAHQDLEGITLERDVAREKQRVEIRVAELIYDGLWHAPLMRALDAFVRETQRDVTGEVRLRLEPGRCFPVGRRAPRGLYDHDLATYGADDAFRHEDSEGFVRLWGLSAQTWSRRQGPGARR